MERVTVTVINLAGLHTRPASLLTKLVTKFDCEIELYKNGNENQKHQAKSILSIMTLGGKKGDQLTFEASGEDEKNAIKAIEEFVKKGCGDVV